VRHDFDSLRQEFEERETALDEASSKLADSQSTYEDSQSTYEENVSKLQENVSKLQADLAVARAACDRGAADHAAKNADVEAQLAAFAGEARDARASAAASASEAVSAVSAVQDELRAAVATKDRAVEEMAASTGQLQALAADVESQMVSKRCSDSDAAAARLDALEARGECARVLDRARRDDETARQRLEAAQQRSRDVTLELSQKESQAAAFGSRVDFLERELVGAADEAKRTKAQLLDDAKMAAEEAARAPARAAKAAACDALAARADAAELRAEALRASKKHQAAQAESFERLEDLRAEVHSCQLCRLESEAAAEASEASAESAAAALEASQLRFSNADADASEARGRISELVAELEALTKLAEERRTEFKSAAAHAACDASVSALELAAAQGERAEALGALAATRAALESRQSDQGLEARLSSAQRNASMLSADVESARIATDDARRDAENARRLLDAALNDRDAHQADADLLRAALQVAQHCADARTAPSPETEAQTEVLLLSAALDSVKMENVELRLASATKHSSSAKKAASLALGSEDDAAGPLRSALFRPGSSPGFEESYDESTLEALRAMAETCEGKMRVHIDAAADAVALLLAKDYSDLDALKRTASRYRDERDAARCERDLERRRLDAAEAAAEEALQKAGAERDDALERLEDLSASQASRRGDAGTADLRRSLERQVHEARLEAARAEALHAVAERRAAERQAAERRMDSEFDDLRQQLHRSQALHAAATGAVQKSDVRLLDVEQRLEEESLQNARLEERAASLLSQLASAERERARASTESRHAHSPPRALMPPHLMDDDAVENQVHAATKTANRDGVFQRAARDEARALRALNAELRAQRDDLADDVTTLKSELARTRLVLHGMEYYGGSHVGSSLSACS